MNYPLLALDLDGTLLNRVKRIDRKNLIALKKYAQAGGHILVVTGRHYSTASKYQNQIDTYTGVKNDYLVTLSGTVTYYQDQIVNELSEFIKGEIVQDFIKICHKHHVKYLIYFKDLMDKGNFIHTNSLIFSIHWRLWKKLKNVKIYPNMDYAAYKLNAISLFPKRLKAVQDEMNQKYPGLMNSYPYTRLYYEYISSKVSKGQAIANLCKRLNLQVNQTATAGDSLNDASALETCKYGAAINPRSSYLASISTITYPYNHNAIADFIYEYLLREPKKAKMFVSDLDGTLLTKGDHVVCNEAKKEIVNLIGKKVPYFCLATGRNVPVTYAIYKTIGLKDTKNCYFICNNGTLIYDLYANKLLYSKTLSHYIAKTVFDLIKEENKIRHVGAIIHTCDERNIQKAVDTELEYVPPLYTINYLYMREHLHHIHLLKTIACDDLHYELPEMPKDLKVTKFVLILDDTPNRDAFAQKLRDTGLDIEVCISGKKNIEVNPKEINKGTAMKILCQGLNIKPYETIVCGDETNDRPMLKLTDWGYCMSQCAQAVKDASNYALDAESSYLVAKSIQHYLTHCDKSQK